MQKINLTLLFIIDPKKILFKGYFIYPE